MALGLIVESNDFSEHGYPISQGLRVDHFIYHERKHFAIMEDTNTKPDTYFKKDDSMKKLLHFSEADPEHKLYWIFNCTFLKAVGKEAKEFIKANNIIVNELGFHVDYRVRNDYKKAIKTLYTSPLYRLLKVIAKPKTAQSSLKIKSNGKLSISKPRKISRPFFSASLSKSKSKYDSISQCNSNLNSNNLNSSNNPNSNLNLIQITKTLHVHKRASKK